MPKTTLIKCRQCGKQINRNVAIELRKGWYVCSDACVEAWKAAHAPKPVQQAPPSPMRQLTDYVQSYAPNTAWVKFGANVQRMLASTILCAICANMSKCRCMAMGWRWCRIIGTLPEIITSGNSA